MAKLVLFLLLLYLHSSEQQQCFSMSDRLPNYPTVEMSHSPDIVLPGKPFNITCIARLPTPLTASDSLIDASIYYLGHEIKGCNADVDETFNLACTVSISNATNKSGKYSCNTRSQSGCTITSKVITLKDITSPRIITNPLSFTNLKYGQEINLTCVAYGIPPPVISWTKDDLSITRPGIIATSGGNTTSLLTINVANVTQFGVYRCQANNSEGSAFSDRANITGPIPPVVKIMVVPPDKSFIFGADFNISCLAWTPAKYPTSIWNREDMIPRKVDIIKDGTTLKTCHNKINNETMRREESCVVTLRNATTRDSGEYVCIANNTIASVSVAINVTVKLAENVVPTITTTETFVRKSGSEIYHFIAIGAVLAFIVLAFGLIYAYRRYKQQRKFRRRRFYTFNADFKNATFNPTDNDAVAELQNTRNINNNPMDTEDAVLDDETYLRFLGVDRNWEIDPGRLVVTDEKLGGGEFGIVKKGIYTRNDGKDMIVAVKQLKDTAEDTERKALLIELDMLRRVGHHPHIVSLIGACTTQEPMSVVIEFVVEGSLDRLLQKSRINSVRDDCQYVNIRSRLTERDLLHIAVGVARGMCHLERKQCIHRDLAARNVLVAKGLVAKVTDFGLAREMSCHGKYINTSVTKIAWKWQSAESLQGVFSTKSDVWSFGILLWEIITLGQEPYKGETSLISFFNKLQCGYHMEKPRHCSDELYFLMERCWEKEPEARPSFNEIQQQLKDFLKDHEAQYINVLYEEEEDNNYMQD